MTKKKEHPKIILTKFDPKDYLGKKFGWLKVIEYIGDIHHYTKSESCYVQHLFRCKCKCGNVIITNSSQLKYGVTKSCGCYRRYNTSKLAKTHGLKFTRLYNIHRGMIDRCYYKSHKTYDRYGGRGIRICDEWYTPGVKGNPGFMNFYRWSKKHGYQDNLTIDRIDNDGPYAPWNCRWVTSKVQSNNKSNNEYIYDGEEHLTTPQFDIKYGFPEGTRYVHAKRAGRWSDAAILYGATHKSLKLRKQSKKNVYLDKDRFIHLIPSLEWQQAHKED